MDFISFINIGKGDYLKKGKKKNFLEKAQKPQGQANS
ncbi:MAG: hypothetical protein UX67_C0032G0001 [Candidatus Woesebacteria bacterium GW2011_GWF2_46_8]|uniref:Uncharacterized protein n=1 Tax=Candidatus Woesebacteria bacterium GW2011_GWF2_46_8 TaxID=1618604 RepID=A0A0G1QS01_9BACT|nr:MAG: hypothetical protein UX67_C0032G0001 [Candidatus Woesebacteria bacterium GW2011_GWF2_46_8]